MTKHWKEIARELGSSDLVDTGSAYMPWRDMRLVDDPHYVGDWVEAEEACKRIAELEAAIRRTWHTLEEAPPPGFITQSMRDAICDAGLLLSPKPWEGSE